MSKLNDYYSAMDSIAPGWAKDKHQKAVADAVACGKGATGNGVARMVSVINCMKSKKQYAG